MALAPSNLGIGVGLAGNGNVSIANFDIPNGTLQLFDNNPITLYIGDTNSL